MGSCGSLACRAHHDTDSGTSEDIFNLLAIRAHTWWGYAENQPGSPDPQSSLLLLRHLGGPVNPVKVKRRVLYTIRWSLHPSPFPSNIFSLERICWDTGEEGRIHFYALRLFKYMIACASYESQIVSKIKYFLFVITRFFYFVISR